ncbi:MAG: DoxX family protein [Verrucomicrobia bacterium]|nr:DoxX family protein [Verrucomicrobiota bacterium]MDA1068165.1 DoxX family protein [Verrucomicrobiota bacterium]
MKKIISLVLRILTAVILIQTLRYKFTGHVDSVQIFTELGMEPAGRIVIGVLELIAGILLLVPSTVAWGAILAWGVMTGAMIGHFTHLGFAGDRLSLFLLAIAVWASSAVLLVLHSSQIPVIRHMFEKSGKP